MFPDELDTRIRRALEETRALPARERYHRATELTHELREHADEAARIRKEALRALWHETGSIRKTAELVGISKGNAQRVLGPLSPRKPASDPSKTT